MAKYIAKPFVAGSPQAEVVGQTMLSFADNLEAEVIKPILESHGFSEIEAEKWYPHQTWMDILKEMQDTLGGGSSMAFVAFGKQVVRNAILPPEMKTIPDALNALHAIHHANLRNIPEDEGYSLEVVDDNHYIVYHNTPNPDDAIYGFLWGLAARFKQPHEKFSVKQIENPAPDKARSAFEVKWGVRS